MTDGDRGSGTDGGIEEKVDHLIERVAALSMEVAELRVLLAGLGAAGSGGAPASQASPPEAGGSPSPPKSGGVGAVVSDRRVSPRSRVDMAVEYTAIDTKDAHGVFSAATVDISPNGLGFYSSRPLGPGTLLAVTISSMDLFAAVGMAPHVVQYLEEGALVAGATVVHCRREPEENRYRVGVRFLCVTDATERKRLVALLKEARGRKR